MMVLRDSWTSVGICLALLVCVWRGEGVKRCMGGFTQAVKVWKKELRFEVRLDPGAGLHGLVLVWLLTYT